MVPLTLHSIAGLTGGELHPRTAGPVTVRGVCTDSRLLQPGQLFVALRGERLDGHDFLRQHGVRSAAGALVSKDRLSDLPSGIPAVAVTDTRGALGAIAAAHRARFALPVVCVAGSNGKTTTKDLLSAMLSTRYRTLRSEASFNNDIGVPLSLLAIGALHEAAVLEAGTNHPGELAPLVRMIAPRYGVIPQVGREHLEHFGSLEGVIEEESALGENLPDDGILFVNGDCEAAGAVAVRTRARVVRAGFGPHNDWRARLVASDWDSTRFEVSAPDPRWRGAFSIGVPGRHMVRNGLLALATAAALGIEPSPAGEALACFRGSRQRLQWSEGRGIRWLDDTYNANADSTLASLQTLSDLPCAGRRVAVLGDMAELGEHTAEAHREAGEAARRLGIDILVCIGRSAAHTALGARGIPGLLQFPDVESAVPALRPLLRPGDCVLAKASRSSRLERIFEALKSDDASAAGD